MVSYISLPFGFVVSEIAKHLLSLNDALQQNTNLRNLQWEPSVHVYSDDSSPCLYTTLCSNMAQQLRGGPNGSQLRLKRVQYIHSPLDFQESLPHAQLFRNHSVPDLCLIVRMSSLLPSLRLIDSFEIQIFYYRRKINKGLEW